MLAHGHPPFTLLTLHTPLAMMRAFLMGRLHLKGWVAEWSCSGLQLRVRRFDSDLSLHV